MSSQTPGTTVYDYPVYIDDRKRAILQVNLKEGRVYLYQRGVIIRSQSLLLLIRFTSSQLTMKLDFLEGDFQVELENFADKAAIFELLTLILETQTGSISGVQTPRKSGDLEKRGIIGPSNNWNKRLVTVYHGYFVLCLPGEETPEAVVELWTDTCSIQRQDDLSFTVSVSGQIYSFRLCDEKKTEDRLVEWIQSLIASRRQPRKLTEDDIAAAVLGPDVFYVQQDENEDEVDAIVHDEDVTDGDVEAQAAMFTSFLPWRRKMRKKPARPITEDEEFVMIELKDVLQSRVEQDEFHTPEKAGEFKPAQEPLKSNEEEKQHLDGSEIITEQKKNEENLPEEVMPKPPSSKPNPAASSSGLPPPPPPPPPPPSAGKTNQNDGIKLTIVPKSSLKQAHWSKVSPGRIEKSLWNEAEDVSSELKLSILEEHFFVKENTKIVGGGNRGSSDSIKRSGAVLLDHKRAQDLGIVFQRQYDRILVRLLDAITSITEIEVFNIDKLNNMKKFVPTSDDRELYKGQTREKLLPVDRVMKDLCDVKELESRLDLAIHVITFPQRLEECSERVSNLSKACREVTTSKLFQRVLVDVRNVGNYLNANRLKGYGVKGFQVTSIDKVLDIKSSQSASDFTVLNYLVKQLETCDKDLLQWTATVKDVPICSDISVAAVQAEVNALKSELKKRRDEVNRLQKMKWKPHEKKYFSDVQSFLSNQEVEVSSLSEKYSSLQDKYKRMLEYLGESCDRKFGEIFSAIADFMRKFDNACEKPHK